MPEAPIARKPAAPAPSRPRPATRAHKRALLGAATGALLLAGCGGGSSVTTKAQYVTKVNALCTSERQQLTQAALEHVKLSDTLEHANSIREQTLAQIEAVKAPSSEAISSEWLQLRRRALALAKKISAVGIASKAAQPLNVEYVTVSNRALRLGLAYGLTSCRSFAGV